MLEASGEGLSGLENAGAEMEKLVSGGEGLLSALDEVGERVEALLFEAADPAAELAGRLGDVAEKIGSNLGELGQKIGELVRDATELLRQGAEWIEAHPEVVEAGARLLVFAMYAWENPDQVLELAQSQPGALGEVFDSFQPLLEALG